MKIYDSKYGQVHQGDCLKIMKQFESNSIETMITDPPAGISFMNKKFDHHRGGRGPWVEYFAERFREALRIIKPGGLALVWALPKTSHWTACALEDAGWIKETEKVHIFGQGWPKGLDFGKKIDEHFGEIRDKVENPLKDRQTAIKNVSTMGDMGPNDVIQPTPVTDLAKTWDGYRSQLKPMHETWHVFRKPCERIYWHELRDITGLAYWIYQIDVDTPTKKKKYGMVPWENNAQVWKHKPLREDLPFIELLIIDGKPEKHKITGKFKPWSTSGFVANALKWGVGGYNIDSCRIETDEMAIPGSNRKDRKYDGWGFMGSGKSGGGAVNQKGRYPGTVIIDDSMAEELDSRSGVLTSGASMKGAYQKQGMWTQKKMIRENAFEANSGGASRYFTRINWEPQDFDFFYGGKATGSEKNEGLEYFPKYPCGGLSGRHDGSLGKITIGKCTHPTVKSLQLMRWLCTLSKPPGGGTVLDIFAGSFSTLIAAYQTDRKFIGIELDDQYCKEGLARLAAAMEQKKFDFEE